MILLCKHSVDFEQNERDLSASEPREMEQKPSVDGLAMNQVFNNLPVILRFLMVFEEIQPLTTYQLIQLFHLCYEITYWLSDKETRKKVCDTLGKIYSGIAQYSAAIYYFKELLAISTETVDLQAMDVAYGNIGNTLSALGNHQDAMKCHKEGLKISQMVHDKTGIAAAYGNIGNVHKALGEFEDAMKCHKECLRICKETGNVEGEGVAHCNMGNVYQSLDQYKKAMECFKEDLRICKEAGDIAGEGLAYCNVGNMHNLLGQLEDALKCYQEQLRICQAIGDVVAVSAAHGNIGNVRGSLGQGKKAMGSYKEQLRMSQALGDIPTICTALNNIGTIHQTLDEYDEAMMCHKECLRISKETETSKTLEGMALCNIGIVHQLQGNYEDAMACHKEDLRICQETGDMAGAGKAYCNIGNVHQSLRQYPEAMKCFEDYLRKCEEAGDIKGKAMAHHNMGTLCTELGDKREAELNLMQSLKCFEELFELLQHNDAFKMTIVDTYIKTYKWLSHILIDSSRIPEALAVLEQGRAKALRDKLLNKYKLPQQKEANVRHENAVDLPNSSDSSFLIFSLLPFDQLQRMHTFVISRDQEPYFKETSRDSVAAPIGDLSDKKIEAMLNSAVKSMIQYLYDTQRKKRHISCEDRSVGGKGADENLEQVETNRYRDDSDPGLLSTRNVLPDDDDSSDDDKKREELSTVLYEVLIAPIEDAITQPELVIISEGPLFALPFSALRNSEGNYLSDLMRIRFGSSLNTLKLLQECSDEKHFKHSALIVGDPVTRKVMFRGKLKNFEDLPGARDEAVLIGEELGETPLVGELATKEEVVRRLKEGVAVIHIAAHGDEETGSVILSPGPHIDNQIPEEEDYLLTIQDVYSCGINTQLVVLSCCHSGRGEVRAEGVVGMSRAFLAVGARAVLASLWAVEDRATQHFMEYFYRHLKIGMSSSASLQQAMKDMRKMEQFSHPYYWAAFFIIGDDITLTK